MKPRSLLLLSLVALAAAFAAALALLLADLEMQGRDSHLSDLRQRLKAGPVDVVLMGDSVIGASDRCDKHHRGIDALMAENLKPLSLYAIHSGGLSPYIYRDYVRAMRDTPHRPRLLLIELNLIALDFGETMHPAARFRLKRLHNEWLETRNAGLLYDYWRYRFTGEINRETQRWRDLPLRIAGRNGMRMADVERIMEAAVPQNDCDAPRPAVRADDLELVYSARLDHRLDDAAPIWTLLKTIVEDGDAIGTRVVFYVTPANLDAVDIFTDKSVSQTIAGNRGMLREKITALGGGLLDFTELASREDFIDVLCACGHMNAAGRERLAAALAASARNLLPK